MADFPRRVEVYYALLPDEENERPIVVMSPDVRNERSHSVLGVPVTGNLIPAPTHVALETGEGGLTIDSVARAENILMLRKYSLRRGPLGPPISLLKMKEI